MASFDPLAGSQIDVDPSLKPNRPTGIQKRRLELIQMFMGQGMDEASAAQAADQYLADYPAATGQSKPTPAPAAPAPMSPQQSMEADLYAQGYSADEARKQAQLQAELRAEREAKQLAQDLSQGGYGQRRVPSPRGLDGRSTQGTPFTSVNEAEGYEARGEAPGMPGLYTPSQRDVDMQARGYVPVYTPDGSVTYRLEAVDGSFVPGAPGRAGSRQDLTGPRPDGKGGLKPGPYRVESNAEGPTGGQQILVPTDETLAKRDAAYAKAKERQDARNPYKDMASPSDRMKRFQAQLQLGGGRLSPQAIQVETMLNGMDPEQRQRALQYMAPGGVLAAEVDAAEARGNRGDDVRLRGIEAQMEESRADRDLQRQQFEARMSADADARAEARLQTEQSMKLQEERLRADNARGLADIDARLKAAQMEWDTRRETAGADRDDRKAQQEAQQAQAKQMQQMAWQQANPGLYDIATGRMNTNAANTALKSIARQSDRFQWLPGGGFGLREATAMNDELLRIADQATQYGIESPLADPGYRRQLIEQWGYASGWSGGRGGWMGDWWQPMPEGL